MGQVGDAGTRRTVIIDARTGGIEREVPGTDRRTEWATDAVVAPDLRSMYLPSAAAARPCDAGWTQVDLTTGVRRPAFGGLADVGEFSLSADGRTLAYVDCRSGLVVRDLPSGQGGCGRSRRARRCAAPAEPGRDPARLPAGAGAGADRLLHLLPTAGTTSVTDGYDLPVAGDCPLSMWRFLDDRRLLALGCAAEPFDNLLVRIDLETRRPPRPTGSACRSRSSGLDVDRSGRRIAAAGKPDDQEPATVYLLRDGRLGGCRSPATAGGGLVAHRPGGSRRGQGRRGMAPAARRRSTRSGGSPQAARTSASSPGAGVGWEWGRGCG